jgi:hypothetical protein
VEHFPVSMVEGEGFSELLMSFEEAFCVVGASGFQATLDWSSKLHLTLRQVFKCSKHPRKPSKASPMSFQAFHNILKLPFTS